MTRSSCHCLCCCRRLWTSRTLAVLTVLGVFLVPSVFASRHDRDSDVETTEPRLYGGETSSLGLGREVNVDVPTDIPNHFDGVTSYCKKWHQELLREERLSPYQRGNHDHALNSQRAGNDNDNSDFIGSGYEVCCQHLNGTYHSHHLVYCPFNGGINNCR